MRGPHPLYQIRLSGGQKAQLRRECRSRSAQHRFVERRRKSVRAVCPHLEREVGENTLRRYNGRNARHHRDPDAPPDRVVGISRREPGGVTSRNCRITSHEQH